MHSQIILFFTLNTSIHLKAEVLNWPQICPKGNLKINNQSQSTRRAWLQEFNLNVLENETEFLIDGLDSIEIPLEQFNVQQRFSLLHLEKSGTLQTQFECSSNSENLSVNATSFEGGQLYFRKSDLHENKLWLNNLYYTDNLFRLELKNSWGQTIKEYSILLKPWQQLNFKLDINQFSLVKVSAENKFTAFNLTSTGSLSPFHFQIQKTQIDPNYTYFLIGPRNNEGDQFIARIKDPTLIAKARDLIKNPQDEKIIFALIEKGHQNYNRNLYKKEKSFWSWSISEVTNISDFGSISCNGLPQILEDHLDEWISYSPRICFWSYRIKKELSPAEINY